MTHPSMRFRCWGQAVVLGVTFAVVLTATATITAVAKPSSSPAASSERRTYTAEESKKLGAEARRLAEAQQHVWDRKMKAVSTSICTGC